MITLMLYDYTANMYQLSCLVYQYRVITYSGYGVVSLLPFLSEKHTCILFLLVIKCINIIFDYINHMKQVYILLYRIMIQQRSHPNMRDVTKSMGIFYSTLLYSSD